MVNTILTRYTCDSSGVDVWDLVITRTILKRLMYQIILVAFTRETYMNIVCVSISKTLSIFYLSFFRFFLRSGNSKALEFEGNLRQSIASGYFFRYGQHDIVWSKTSNCYIHQCAYSTEVIILQNFSRNSEADASEISRKSLRNIFFILLVWTLSKSIAIWKGLHPERKVVSHAKVLMRRVDSFVWEISRISSWSACVFVDSPQQRVDLYWDVVVVYRGQGSLLCITNYLEV